MRWRIVLLALLAIGAYAIGRSRVSFNVDVLDLLPSQLPEVAGLKLFRSFTADQNELILTLELPPGSNPSAMDTLSVALRERLSAEKGLASSVSAEPFWQSAEELLADWSGYLWLNGDPGEVRSLKAQLEPPALAERLAASLDTLALSLEPAEVALLAYDPAGFVPSDLATSNQSRLGRSLSWFRSEDGLFQAIYLKPANTLADYRATNAWVSQVQDVVTDWKNDLPAESAIAIGLTGEPAFAAEISAGMERDMKSTVLPAIACIALLFWIFYRKLRPLALLIFSLALIFALTFGLGGLAFGSLSVMSVGFAAILVGLAVDYGVVAYQESLVQGTSSVSRLRRSIGPSICWAAVTTAAVFASLNLSSLPGIRQLGSLVALGILLGAAVMIWFYLPAVARPCSPENCPQPAPLPAARNPWRFLPPVSTVLLLTAASMVLLIRDLPDLERDFSVLRPRNSPAGEALVHLQERLRAGRGREEQLPILVHASDEKTLLESLRKTQVWIEAKERSGKIRAAWFPAFLWPNQAHQEVNQPLLIEISRRREAILQSFAEAGFDEEGSRLARSVLESWANLEGQPVPAPWPDGPASREITGRLARRAPGDNLLLGIVEPSGPTTLPGQPGIPGVFLTGWPTLGAAILPLIERDVYRVFLPMAALLTLVLACIFRNAREAALALASMSFSALLLLAVMAALDIEWNLMNLSAIPLLLGTGIDYVIHMIFALRRHANDPSAIRNGIRRALVFCCLSTAAGFGSLSLASNQGLAALGQVCAIGILTSTLSATFLLPWWWRVLRRPASA